MASSEYWKYRPLLQRARRFIVMLIVIGVVVFGITLLVTWIWAPMSTAQAFRDGYATGFSTNGVTDFPFGRWVCVSAWNAEVTGLAGNRDQNSYAENGGYYTLGFVQGGPPATRIISMRNQDTGTALGNTWMKGCRTGLAALGKGY